MLQQGDIKLRNLFVIVDNQNTEGLFFLRFNQKVVSTRASGLNGRTKKRVGADADLFEACVKVVIVGVKDRGRNIIAAPKQSRYFFNCGRFAVIRRAVYTNQQDSRFVFTYAFCDGARACALVDGIAERRQLLRQAHNSFGSISTRRMVRSGILKTQINHYFPHPIGFGRNRRALCPADCIFALTSP